MVLGLTVWEAAWFAPFVLPICLYVAWSDCRGMIIPNKAVLALLIVFFGVGLIALPFMDWAWRWSHFAAILVAGMVMNAAGAVGAGDAKFAAAAAPFIALGDLVIVLLLLAATILAAFATHRIAKHTGLRNLAPDWKSWETGSDFPMGLALGPALALYLLLGLIFGAVPS
ncbi:prepilin peptidase [Primorskyibacter sp. S187A]|uniref:prepilin peptidase n=1 Tax=Primorskyibacter sp. S187A TaxID=3415130 RepID=UPI003C7D4E09